MENADDLRCAHSTAIWQNHKTSAISPWPIQTTTFLPSHFQSSPETLLAEQTHASTPTLNGKSILQAIQPSPIEASLNDSSPPKYPAPSPETVALEPPSKRVQIESLETTAYEGHHFFRNMLVVAEANLILPRKSRKRFQFSLIFVTFMFHFFQYFLIFDTCL
ncbi:hypothetical protein BpHYR1_008510 [Brachionus plicatilis]|uniref:Uncharacterized protein n=1 Tax=Brachionus plicatilis TaxID=10195 RepID=A0A3M7T4Z1_BRAPC|nr:hypothetical protein BpHYR1_008510 [Brachionus plicatilis]